MRYARARNPLHPLWRGARAEVRYIVLTGSLVLAPPHVAQPVAISASSSEFNLASADTDVDMPQPRLLTSFPLI